MILCQLLNTMLASESLVYIVQLLTYPSNAFLVLNTVNAKCLTLAVIIAN